MGRRKVSVRREPVFDVTPDPAPECAGGKSPAPKPAPRKRRTKRQAATQRTRLARKLYWGVVGALWMGIAAIGAVVAIGIFLPPIQSLEIPKRPPSIQIVDLNGRLIATRGEYYGDPISLKELPLHV